MILILLIAAIFGLVLSTTLFFKRSTNTVATKILGSFYFLLSIYALQAFIIDGGYLEHFTWFFLWPLLPYHLIFIPIYYYFKVILTDQLKWHNAEIILFIPFFLGLIDIIYVYLQPEAFYNNIISQTISNPEKRLNVHYWLLDLDQHLLIRHVWQLGILVVLLPQVWSFIKKGKNDELKSILNKWLITFWSILTVMAILAILYAFEKMFQENLFHSLLVIGKGGGIITFFLYIALFLIGIIPIYFPSILYGYPQQVKPSSNPVAKEQTDDLKFGLDEQEVKLKLEGLKKSKSYLNQSFTLTECAQELGMPSHHISYFLKSYYGLSFSSFKNNLRMDHAKKLIEDGYLQNNTIEALAGECGFASRTSFSKAFKNASDVSPSQYALETR
ncbi:helix-turn-helix transcriptional regulator [Salinimicrobium sediminilitoris]|uniref:helix-turn-helix transcriptional regulator n=1 Tax=Salinimicrobium sediminilitoris TaxID=2876715 RepID=UPI001E552086|nr:helix-turn-helix domain-containing protein [Salinimicrobium sediminilitoris]MCC8361089.1 helix-turn-helix domain-containing protein [Salinimicrobium sediminilitoris]